MKSIETRPLIDRSRLSKGNYFQTLLEQGAYAGMLTEEDVRGIRSDCMALLAKKAKELTGGDSSMRESEAKSLLDSIAYTIGLWLKTRPSPEDALAALTREGVFSAYRKGRSRIDVLMRSAKAMHSALMLRFVDTGNEFWRSTAEEGIKGFIKLYRPDYAAQETHITADYPTFTPVNGLTGIEFILEYLQNIYFENLFLSRFDLKDICKLLSSYDSNYKNIPFCPIGPILGTAVGCALCGSDPVKLSLTRSGAAYLLDLFSDCGAAKALAVFSDAAEGISVGLGFSPNLKEYVFGCLPQLSSYAVSAAQKGLLKNVFVVKSAEPGHYEPLIDFGVRMDDEAFRAVVNELLLSRDTASKLDVIRQNVRSLADIEDILLYAELESEDMRALFALLSPEQLAAFLDRYCFGHAAENDSEEGRLKDALVAYLSSLPAEERGKVLAGARGAEQSGE